MVFRVPPSPCFPWGLRDRRARARARAGGSRGAGNNQTSRMGLLKTQRAVVFWSAEKEPEKPSVPWGSQHSVLAIVCWEPESGARIPGRYLAVPDRRRRGAETAGAGVGGAGSCSFDAAP